LEVPLNIFTISFWFLGAENKKPPLRWVANRKLCGDCTYDPRSRKRNLADWSGCAVLSPPMKSMGLTKSIPSQP
jgi:hypothetical protein